MAKKIVPENPENQEKIEETQPGQNPLDSIAADLMAKEPGISEHVIEQELEKETERIENAQIDVNGATFDPAQHAQDENGNPIKTASGAFRRKSGRKSGATVTQTATRSQLGNIHAGKTQEPPINAGAVMAAKGATNLLFQMGIMIGGDEWQPVIDNNTGHNEPAFIEKAFTDYFVANEINDFPPGISLCLAVGICALPRLRMPKTQTRLQKLGAWCKGFFGKKKETENGSTKAERAERVS